MHAILLKVVFIVVMLFSA